jgi:hypothetical protein
VHVTFFFIASAASAAAAAAAAAHSALGCCFQRPSVAAWRLIAAATPKEAGYDK